MPKISTEEMEMMCEEGSQELESMWLPDNSQCEYLPVY
jgi:hypothetical protein